MTIRTPELLDGCSLLLCDEHGWSYAWMPCPPFAHERVECYCPWCMAEKIQVLLSTVTAVNANSSPTAISLSLKNRIRAFFVITRQALEDVSTRENMSEACERLQVPPPAHL